MMRAKCFPQSASKRTGRWEVGFSIARSTAPVSFRKHLKVIQGTEEDNVGKQEAEIQLKGHVLRSWSLGLEF